MALKILPIEALSAEAQALYDAVNNEPDFPCVLIVTSFLDQCLVSLLERFLIEDPVSTELLKGALGRFSSRAKLCYALGIIPESLMRNLLKFGEIRNRFAHSYLSLKFDSPEIVEICESLAFPEIAEWVGVDGQTGEVGRPSDPWARFRHPRVKFTLIAVSMASRLILFGLGTQHRPTQPSGWC